MKKSLLYLAFVVFVFASCSSVASFSYTERQGATPSYSVVCTPVTAELIVSPQKISYAEKIQIMVSSLKEADVKKFVAAQKEIIMHNALVKHNADVMVNPIFDVQTNTTSVTFTLTGYPATYQNFRTATKDDSWYIASPSIIPSNTAEKKTTGTLFK